MSNNYIDVAGSPLIGVLALQGDFAKHAEAIVALGGAFVFVRKAEQLPHIDGLVIPGGESTALLRLLSADFREQLSLRISAGLPTLVTCAGAILVAETVNNPAQESLGLIDLAISRNDYGRQLNSFVSDDVVLSSKGRDLLETVAKSIDIPFSGLLSGVFIRAPRIISFGEEVTVLASHNEDPVLVQQGSLLVATFHSELVTSKSILHQHLLNLASSHCHAVE